MADASLRPASRGTLGRALTLLWLSLVLTVAALVVPSQAFAQVTGTAPTLFRNFRVFGDSVSVGNTLMRNLPSEPLVNAVLLSESQARVRGVPVGSTVEGAFLFWSGSVDDDFGADNTATFRLPNGTSRSVRADRCLNLRSNFGGGLFVDYFYCRADVTSIVAAGSSTGDFNGLYTLGGVTAMPGTLAPGGGCVETTCQAMYGGWSMVLVYESETVTTLRDVTIFDGFQSLDENPTAAAVTSYTIAGFDVANPPEATLRIFGMEGDALLGVPPQDSDPVLRCTTCFDYLSVNGTKLSDPLNPPNNLFNSTLPEGSAIGIDIDSFDISTLVRAGDTSVRIEVGSGDGNPATGQENGAGGGELFLTGYSVVTVNRLAPNFRTDGTFLTADPLEVAPGESIFYTLQVRNDGSLASTNTLVRLNLPPGVEYVPGSTRVDGTAIADGPGGAAPWVAGINLGSVPATGDNDRRITFRLRVLPTTAGGTLIRNQGRITSTELTEPTLTNEAVVRVIAPQVNTPRKTFTDLNGGAVEPGDLITYTIAVRKNVDNAVAGLTFVDDISRFARLRTVAVGSFTDESRLTGGANGTGQVRVTNISAPRGVEQVTFSYTVQVLTSAELIAAGVDPADIDGLIVSNQGALSAPFLPATLLTDNPSTAATPDATTFRLSSSVNFRNPTTFKQVSDDDGGTLEPGDSVTYTISINNSGTSAANVDLTDDLPAFFSGASLLAPVAGVTLRPAPNGVNRTGRIEAFGLSVGPRTTIVIRVRGTVASDAPGGTSFRNTARLDVPAFPDQSQDLTTADLVVVAGPVFDTTTKTATGAVGGFEPGDTVTWTITVPNTGNRDATNVVVSDVVDSRFTSITPLDGGVYNAATRTITWTIPTLAQGASATVRFTSLIAVTVPDGTSISNQARVTADGVTTAALSDDPVTAALDDPTVIRVQALPELQFTKTVADVNGGSFEPGDVARYTLRVRNIGRAAAASVVITDPVDAAFSTITPANGGLLAGRTITWDSRTTPTLASIAPAAEVTVTFDAVVGPDVDNGQVVSNQATVTSVTGGLSVLSDSPDAPGVADPTTFTISSLAELSESTKTVRDINGGAAQPGDTLEYTITLANNGSGPARDVVVSDPIDANLTDITPQNGGVFNPATRTITWTPAAVVPADGTLELRFSARVATGLANGTVVSNQATVSGADIPPTLTDDPATPAADDPTRITIESRADFATSTKAVENLSGNDEFRPGDPIRYTLVIRNTGTSPGTNITVTDPVDGASLTSISANAGGVVAGSTVTWTIPSLAVDEEVELTIEATLGFPLADGTIVSNQASIRAPGVPDDVTDDPDTDTEDDPTVFTVVSRPDLGDSTKTFVDLNGGSVVPGDVVEYTLTLVNTGTQAATNVEVSDLIDENLTEIDAGAGIFDGTTVSFNAGTTPALASIEPGEDNGVVLTFRATVVSPIDNGTRVSNQASITSGALNWLTDDPATAAEDDPTTFQVISSFDFSDITKVAAADPDGYRPGDEVTWTIRFSNTGTAPARNVIVTDVLPAELRYVSSSPGGRLSGSTVTFTAVDSPSLALVDVGATVELTIRTTLTEPLDNGLLVSNQAQVNADEGADPFLSDDPATAGIDDPTTITVTATPGLDGLTKRVEDVDGDGIFEPGDEIRWTITVVNGGDGAAQNVRVRDPIDTTLVDNVEVTAGGVFNGAAIVWDATSTPALASLAPGAERAVVLTVRARVRTDATDGAIVANQAFAEATDIEEVASDDPATADIDDPTRFSLVARARLDAATKDVSDINGGDIEAGDVLEYRIRILNEGTQIAQSLQVIDPIATELTDVQPLNGGVFDGTSIVWDLRELIPGATAEVRFRATVRGDVAPGTIVANQANVVAQGLDPVPTDDPNTPEADDPTRVTVNADPAFDTSTLTVVDVNGGFVEPGDELLWELTVANTGAGNAERVNVQVPIDPALLEVSTVEDGGTFTAGVVSWNNTPGLEEIEAGGSVVVRFRANIAADVPNGTTIFAQGDITDASEVTGVTDNPATDEIGDPTGITLFFPELSLATKEGVDLDGDTLRPGDRVRWFIRFGAGQGPALTDVRVFDTIDPLLTDIEPLDGGVFNADSQSIEWTSSSNAALQNVQPGQEIVLRFDARVRPEAPTGATISNQGVLRSTEVPNAELTDDPATAVEDDPTILVIDTGSVADLTTSTKTVQDLNGDLVEPGDLLRYFVTINNSGAGVATGLSVLDTIPAFSAFEPGSVTVDGAPVDADAATLASGLELADLAPGASTVVAFDVRVNDDTPTGAIITNQAIASEEGGSTAPTDDPATPESDDPTSVVVGGAPDLSRTIKLAELGDENDDGFPQAGETITYEIRIPNRGTAPATNVLVRDVLPENVGYSTGSISLNGLRFTDAGDGDLGEFFDGVISVRIPILQPGETAAIRFTVSIVEGERVVNQGELTFDGGSELTDDDGNPLNGDNPTVVTLDGAAGLLVGSKSVADATGDDIEEGDTLTYTISIRANGPIEAGQLVVDEPDTGLILGEVLSASPGVDAVVGDVTAQILLPALGDGDEVTVVLSATIGDEFVAGDTVCNRITGPFDEQPDPACVIVGGRAGVSQFRGTVYRPIEASAQKDFDPAIDEPLADFLVRIARADNPDTSVADVVSGPDGTFELPPILSGSYVVRAFANRGPDFGGALFTEFPLEAISGANEVLDVEVRPAGQVYDAGSGATLGNVRAMLFYAADEPDATLAGRMVPAEQFADESQQNQLVPSNGFYRFDVPVGPRYEVRIDTSATTYSFPSSIIPPLADVLRASVDGEPVVGGARPGDVPEAERQYYLRFELSEEDAELKNNHIPLDPFSTNVSLTKRADRVSAYVGEIITYTVTVSNRSASALQYDPATDRGGAWMVDAIPSTFRYVDGSAVGLVRGEVGDERRILVDTRGDLLLEFGELVDGELQPLSIPPNADLEIRYQLVIGSSAEPGTTARNRAELRSADGGIQLSNVDVADVRIDYDPVFDQGTLIGKVWCDTDGDGRQDRGEPGLPGARVYLDAGFYTEVDVAGQYHFADIDPGLHLVKIDVNTLPTGSVLTTDERRLFNVTRGTPSLVDFGVSCVENRVEDIEVTPGDGTLVEAQRLRAQRYAEVDGSLVDSTLTVDGVPVIMIDAALTAAVGDAPAAPLLRQRSETTPEEGSTAALPDPGMGTAEGSAAAEGSGLVAPAPVAQPMVVAEPAVLSARINPDGELAAPIHFAFAASPGATRWVLEVSEAGSGLVAWQQAADGPPPSELVWDGTIDGSGVVLAPQTTYYALLRVFSGDNLYARSAPIELRVDGTRTRWMVDETFTGVISSNNRNNDELEAWVSSLVPSLQQNRELPVTITAHVDDTGDEAAEAETTRSQARQVADLLEAAGVDGGRLELIGAGATRPLYPNVGERTRNTNRRIEVRVADPDPEVLEAEPAGDISGPALWGNERELEFAADGRFDLAVPRPDDGLIAFHLRNADLSETAALVAVRDIEDMPSYANTLLPAIPVQVDPAGRTVEVGGVSHSLAALNMRLTADDPIRRVANSRLDSPFAFTVENAPENIESYNLEIFNEFGGLVWQRGEAGDPGNRLRWTGDASDGAFNGAGFYTARLTVRLRGGGLAATPALELVVANEDEEVEAPTPQTDLPATAVRINGDVLPGSGPTWTTEVRSVSGRTVIVDVSTEDARLLLPVTIPEGFTATFSTPVPVMPQNVTLDLSALTSSEGSGEPAADEAGRQSEPAADERSGRRRSNDRRPEPTPEPAADDTEAPAPAPAPEDAPAPAPAPTDDDLFRPISSIDSADQPWLMMRPGSVPSLLQLDARQIGGGAEAMVDATAPPTFAELENFYASELDIALSTDEGADIAALVAAAPAGQINVQLPPQGFPLQASRLPIYGTTNPTNRVFVNGTEVMTREGEFNTVIDLPGGASTITIETLDVDGNRGRIEWPVEVANFRYFVMALGDSAVGTTNSEIAGSQSHNSTMVGSTMLYGQARAYFKGWLSGEEIMNGYFDEIEMTAYVDTSRRREYEAFIRETIQPDVYYPVFGDSSQQVSDINTRGKVYVLLQADESTVTLGNYNTRIQGVSLMRYDRNLYGGQVVFDDVIADNYRTQLQAHVADEDTQSARTFNYLRGTGGSIYYLENRPVIEGSEQVFMIVRDRVSGVELARIPQARNTDYTVRYREGRIVMRQPVPSIVDDSMALGGYATTRSVLQGHPVYLEVAYDYEGVNTNADTSWGVFGRETFFNIFSVGGGVIQESRAGQRDYRVWSAETGVGTSTTRVDVEFARSTSNDLSYGYSDDGGLTFNPFRLDNSRDANGDAFYARGQFELAEWINTDRSRVLLLDTYYNRQDRGFFANGNVLDQGEEKFGALARWFVNENHSFTIRHDSILTELDNLQTDLLEDTTSLNRRVTTGQYEWQYDPVAVVLSYQNTFTDDIRRVDGFQNDIVGASIQYRIVRWLRMGVEQEIVVRGEDPRLIRGADDNETTRVEDRFITAITASAEVANGVEIQAAQRFRYSGENATMIGLRAAIDEDSAIYTQQRLTSFRDNHGTAASTVVGGEQRYGGDQTPGRSYGEYHMDTGVSGERSRAVLGFGQGWEPIRGLSFNVGYERSQTLASDGGDSASSRNTASFGAQLIRYADIKVSTLFEARFDHGSLIAPASNPCLGNDVSGNPLYCRDRLTAVGDRRQLVTMTTAEWKVTRDFTFFSRFDLVTTQNQTLDLLEARDMEATFGGAYRPLMTNWLNVLGRYTYLETLAPYDLELDEFRHDRSHVLSLSPIIELPFNLQLVEKVAWRGMNLRTEGMPEVDNNLILLVNRLNYHLTRMFDIGVEYRFLRQSLTQDWQHGVLVEFNWIVEDYVRLGIGYNFTRFAEDELGDFNRDASGVFFRVTAQY